MTKRVGASAGVDLKLDYLNELLKLAKATKAALTDMEQRLEKLEAYMLDS